jgi:hypothetical protein
MKRMIETTVVSRLTWVHGEALYPSCRLPIDAQATLTRS